MKTLPTGIGIPFQPPMHSFRSSYSLAFPCATGRWEFNATPRLLPWHYKDGLSLCDERWQSAGQGLIRQEANQYARTGGDPAGWTVRPELKYQWKVPGSAHCPMGLGDKAWSALDPARFCRAVAKGKTFVFLGDSLSEQMMLSYLSYMTLNVKPAYLFVEETPMPECQEWANSKVHLSCFNVVTNGSVCGNHRIIYIRNDLLQVDNNPRSFDYMPWSTMPELGSADVIILNRGAHYVPDDEFGPTLRAALTFLRNKYPDKLFVYRSTPPGHADCQNFTKPLERPQDPSILPFNWDKFAAQNVIAERVCEEVGMVFMDVVPQTILRADGHNGYMPTIDFYDCLHYCVPGPADVWAEYMVNALLRLL